MGKEKRKGTFSFLPPIVTAASLPAGLALRARPCFQRYLEKGDQCPWFTSMGEKGEGKSVIFRQTMEPNG